MRPAILLIASVVLAGCHAMIPGTSTGTRIPDDRALPKALPQGGTSRADPARDASKKRVSAKEAPTTLIAADRSLCYVTPEEFRTVGVGENYSCAWSPGAGRP